MKGVIPVFLAQSMSCLEEATRYPGALYVLLKFFETTAATWSSALVDS